MKTVLIRSGKALSMHVTNLKNNGSTRLSSLLSSKKVFLHVDLNSVGRCRIEGLWKIKERAWMWQHCHHRLFIFKQDCGFFTLSAQFWACISCSTLLWQNSQDEIEKAVSMGSLLLCENHPKVMIYMCESIDDLCFLHLGLSQPQV